MKLSTTVTAAVGAAVGLAVAVGAYQASSAVGQDTVNTSVGLQQPATSPVAQTQLADCEPPSHLVGTDCVTDVERIVVMNDQSRSHEAQQDSSPDAAEQHASAEDSIHEDSIHEDSIHEDSIHEVEAHHEDGPQEPEDH